ncbi:MAG: hypothetical protein COY80_01990 [Candidatus Pacebacteria bacterium CG_4_10_14_0_8_um_filter_42_14]|nr:MAG: hypothetical protein COY80_01990 [Candidatus Pacebacteria bacterium CG_4_10_14_0_8_um_filter_42_14]
MFILLCFVFLISPVKAEAYLDPGTGSYITQVAIGLIFGGGYLFKVYFSKIRSFFSNFHKSLNKSDKKQD